MGNSGRYHKAIVKQTKCVVHYSGPTIVVKHESLQVAENGAKYIRSKLCNFFDDSLPDVTIEYEPV